MKHWQIPNNDYFRWWEGDIPGWPLAALDENVEKWLDWFEEWQKWPDNDLNEGDGLLIEMTTTGYSLEEILEAFGMNIEQFNGSCQHLFDSACRFAKYKTKSTKERVRKNGAFPDMTGFAQGVGDIICTYTTQTQEKVTHLSSRHRRKIGAVE